MSGNSDATKKAIQKSELVFQKDGFEIDRTIRVKMVF